jgi:hypothetical protein
MRGKQVGNHECKHRLLAAYAANVRCNALNGQLSVLVIIVLVLVTGLFDRSQFICGRHYPLVVVQFSRF